MKNKVWTGLLAALVSVAGPASAVTFNLQPVGGRSWNSTGFTNVTYTDSYVSNISHPNTNVIWINPVQVDTNVATVYSGTAHGAGDATGTGTTFCTRLVSFTSLGYVSAAGPTNCNNGSLILPVTLSAVTVPAEGNLFVQTTLHCGTSASCNSTLRSIRVTR
ncbi:MAG: hypothetical protein IT377_28055 [Polyangiaceae bacterium]|nr:hypothetical protein [Polyangiaceae bacterium]